MSTKYLIQPHEKDLGGFSVRRFLPYAKQRTVGPWIFFDHMGPAEFSDANGINVRPHPHINLATVTYLFEGEIFHRDSLGNELPINPGDINLMVAGSGITHSEREREEKKSQPRTLDGLQLWHALPEADEEIDPAFYHYPSTQIPFFQNNGVQGRVMMGSAYGVTSPVKTFAETLYLEAQLKTNQELPLPQVEQMAVYVVAGEITIDGQDLAAFEMAIIEDNTQPRLLAQHDSRIAVVGGERMSQRYIEWNFVSSRKERIEQAKVDWREGRFPKVINDADEFIPLP